MRIIAVNITACPSPGHPGGGVAAPARHRLATDCVVELKTDENLTGVVIGSNQVAKRVERLAREVLFGEDPRAVTSLWQKMVDWFAGGGRPTLDYELIALLDIALWDLKAKSNNEPLWKSLGGSRPRANSYASLNCLSLDEREISEWFRSMAATHGFREGKLTVGLDRAVDTRRLYLVQAALRQNTPYPALMIDAGDRWTPRQAISNIKVMEKDFDLTWVEGSEQAWGLEGLKQVSNSVLAAVCGTRYRDNGNLFPAFEHGAVDIITIDLRRAGITGSLQIADAAYGFELPVSLAASPGNIAAHLASALPNFMSMEVVDSPAIHEVFSSDVRIENGWAVAGDKPGNGLSINHDVLTNAAPDSLPARPGEAE